MKKQVNMAAKGSGEALAPLDAQRANPKILNQAR